MDVPQMLHNMCHRVLSNADVKAICKSRGFSAREAASRALFENFYLSDIGLEETLGSLSQEEIALLHKLKFVGEPVAIPFFAVVYGEKGRSFYGTFTQRYREVLKQVRRSLVRKGVLLMAEADDTVSQTRMEGWRFRLPHTFERFLPPPITATRTFEGEGDFRSDVPRGKLMEIAGRKKASPIGADKQYDLTLEDGVLRMGDREFRAGYLLEWQQACAKASLPSPKKETRTRKVGYPVPPFEALTSILGQLGKAEWVRPDELSLLLRIFCNAELNGEEICKAGWQWGYLTRQKGNGETCYRLAEEEAEADMASQHYLYPSTGQGLTVNLETVPFGSLEYLVGISDLQLSDSGSAHLNVLPNLVRMGRAFQSVRDHPLTDWLRKHSPEFKKAFRTVERRWGKQVLHDNLLIARVSDLGLRVEIERTLSEKVVLLSDDYIAFPHRLRNEIEKLVTMSGLVIKTVRKNG